MTGPIVSVEIGRSTWQGPAEEAPGRAATARHPHWAVTVETGGEQIVRLETECYGGRELSAADEDAVRTAAQHLLAFIGDRSADMAECAAFSAGYEAGERDGRASGQQVRALVANLSVWAGKAHPDQQLVDLAHVLAILDSNPAALTPDPQPEGQDALKISPEYQALFDEVKQRAQPEEDFPQPSRKDGREPCGECRLPAGETCDICGAISRVPTPTPTTPTAQEAVPLGWITDKAMRTLLSETSGVFRIDHGKRRGTECRVPIYAHPPQPSEAVAEAAYLAGFMASSEGYNGEYPDIEYEHDARWCFERDAALRALKGGREVRSSRRRTYPVESLVPVRDSETITVKLDRERGVFRRVDHLDWISTAVAAALAPARRRMQRHD